MNSSEVANAKNPIGSFGTINSCEVVRKGALSKSNLVLKETTNIEVYFAFFNVPYLL